MIKQRIGLLAGLTMLTTSVFAGTPTGTDMLFDASSFDDVKVGTTLTYSHVRSADENIPV